MRTLPAKTQRALGWHLPPPATMTREQAIAYLCSRTIFEDVLASGWLGAVGRKSARKSESGRGRGDTLIFATAMVIAASERMAREGYPPVSAREAKGGRGDG